MSIAEEVNELAEEFDLLGDWEERYRYVIDLGRELEPLPEAERTEANKVHGCASQVWLSTRLLPDGRLAFRGDSDAHIVKGLVAVMLRLYSNRRPEEIAGFDARQVEDIVDDVLLVVAVDIVGLPAAPQEYVGAVVMLLSAGLLSSAGKT